MLEAVSVHLFSCRVFPEEVLKTTTLHWAIHDESGRSVIVEYIQGKRMVHENGPRVMTNGPDIQWHWRNLNTRVHLSPSYPYQNDMLQVKTNDAVGTVLRPIGHGWNLFRSARRHNVAEPLHPPLLPAGIFHGSKPHHELRGCC